MRMSVVGSFLTAVMLLGMWCAPATAASPCASLALVAQEAALGQTTGRIKVIIAPAEVNAEGARWRVDGGAWKRSNRWASNLPAGVHNITFRNRAGWIRPGRIRVNLAEGKSLKLNAAYILNSGSMNVFVDPSPAVDEGAQWSIDGGPWNANGATVKHLAPGPHEVSYQTLDGWLTPEPETLEVAIGEVVMTRATYTLELGTHVVLGYNDLGMHCMNQDFSKLMILPPYNTFHAQVIRRGHEPKLLNKGVTVSYEIPGNTVSYTKTNFWDYDIGLFGVDLPLDVGLTGNGLSGTMVGREEEHDWMVTGVPITPITDDGELQPYNLAKITVTQNGAQIARTNTVIPVSWEISCDLCHEPVDGSVDTNILRAHDRIHGTTLEQQTPVVCGSCHAQAPLGLNGAPGVPSLSSSMHSSHASRLDAVGLENKCYACHPGFQTNCQRDVHFERGMSCEDCHESMQAVGNPARRPWIDEPKCGSCHQRSHFKFEEEGKLYRESRGHHEVQCAVCHGSPHAITPTVTPEDNVQAIMHQGTPGTIDCVVCHITRPHDEFEHHL